MRTGLTLNVLCLAALACVGLALASRVSAGACAMPSVVMEIVPSARDAIPSDQGILLQAGTDPRRAVTNAPPPFSRDEIRVEAHLEREGLLFGDLNDPNSEIAKRVAGFGGAAVRADLRLDPGVRYAGL